MESTLTPLPGCPKDGVHLSSRQGITSAHVARCLTAAKNPKLESKLMNMPVRLSIDTVERYMGSVLAAAGDGDFSLIEDVQVK